MRIDEALAGVLAGAGGGLESAQILESLGFKPAGESRYMLKGRDADLFPSLINLISPIQPRATDKSIYRKGNLALVAASSFEYA